MGIIRYNGDIWISCLTSGCSKPEKGNIVATDASRPPMEFLDPGSNEISGNAFANEHCGIAVRKGNAELPELINSGKPVSPAAVSTRNPRKSGRTDQVN